MGAQLLITKKHTSNSQFTAPAESRAVEAGAARLDPAAVAHALHDLCCHGPESAQGKSCASA